MKFRINNLNESMSLINYKNINLKGTNKLIVACLCSSVLALAACQPATDDTTNDAETTSVTTEDTAAETTVTETEDDTATIDDASTTDTQVASTDFGKEYVDSMDDMHEDMMEGMQTNDADVAFAKGMLPHHEGAVHMAEIQLKYGKDDTMRKLAQDIIIAQEAEIEQMENWLEDHPDTAEQSYTKEMQQAYSDSMDPMHTDMMQGILDQDADMAFAKGMLPHHEGAIAMAEVQLKYGKDEEMRKLAQAIIDAQNTEIKLMQDWINEHS